MRRRSRRIDLLLQPSRFQRDAQIALNPLQCLRDFAIVGAILSVQQDRLTKRAEPVRFAP